MIDHVSIGVRDVAKTKRFYDAALTPLGYQCLSEGKDSLGYGRGTVALWISAARTRCRPICNPACTSASPLRRQRAWTPSTPPRSPPEDGTTACPACAPTTVQAITRPSSSIPTATGSRPIAINPPREPRPELKFCLGAQGDKLTAPRQNAARGSAGAGDATSAGRTPCQHDALCCSAVSRWELPCAADRHWRTPRSRRRR